MSRAFKLPTSSGTFGPQGPETQKATAMTGGSIPFKFFGHSGVRETSGVAVTFTIRDEASASGNILCEVVLAANGYAPPVSFAPSGVLGEGPGAYMHIESGTGVIEGSALLG